MEEYIFWEDDYYNAEYKKISEEFKNIINTICDKFKDKFTTKYFYHGFNNFNDNKIFFEYKSIKIFSRDIGFSYKNFEELFCQELYYNDILITQEYFCRIRKSKIFKIDRKELNKLLKEIEEIK